MKRRVLSKTTPFHKNKIKKKQACYCSLSSSKKLLEWLFSRLFFRLVWPPNPTKLAPKCPHETPLSWRMVWSVRKGWKRLRWVAQSGHLGQFTALSCQIWQLEVHTLSQRLRCFPTESRAEIFPQHRKDCPLPQPINRIGFDDLREGKFGSKVSQKPAFLPKFCRFFFFFLLIYCSRHEQ